MRILRFSRELWEQMRANVMAKIPEEACGLLAGCDDQGEKVMPITNELHSPDRFRMAAQELVEAFISMDGKGWELTAIYHSHPRGPAQPSATDLKEFAYPGSLYLIWSPQDGEWSCRAFEMQEQESTEIPISIL